MLQQNYEFASENVISKSLHDFKIEDKDHNTLWSVNFFKLPLMKGSKQNPLEEFVKNMRD